MPGLALAVTLKGVFVSAAVGAPTVTLGTLISAWARRLTVLWVWLQLLLGLGSETWRTL